MRVAFNTVSGLTIACIAMGCCFLPLWEAYQRSDGKAAPWVGTTIFLSMVSVVVLLAFASVVWWLAGLLDRRASTPLPPPPADPLATYRDAPAECPRHPFARGSDGRS
jgi:hypothetical protein